MVLCFMVSSVVLCAGRIRTNEAVANRGSHRIKPSIPRNPDHGVIERKVLVSGFIFSLFSKSVHPGSCVTDMSQYGPKQSYEEIAPVPVLGLKKRERRFCRWSEPMVLQLI